MKISNALVVGCVALAAIAPNLVAHFRLLKPGSWIQENQLGDPQKLGPYGGTSGEADWHGCPCSGLRETPYQDSGNRVSPARTVTTANGRRSVSAAIQYPPTPPVLADGVFQHIAKFDKEQETGY
jgi:hypothetical protein